MVFIIIYNHLTIIHVLINAGSFAADGALCRETAVGGLLRRPGSAELARVLRTKLTTVAQASNKILYYII